MNMLRHASTRRRWFSSSIRSATLTTARASFSSAATSATSTSTMPTTLVTQPTVVVALSGGVDSSVAAALLKQRYASAIGTNGSTGTIGDSSSSNNGQGQGLASSTIAAIHMSNWNATQHDDDSLDACSSEQDWKDAVAVAQHLQLPVQRVHFESTYWTLVFEPYLDQLIPSNPMDMDMDTDTNSDSNGTDRPNKDIGGSRMGNPDMLCNRFVKFGALRDYCLDKYGTDTLLATGHYARLWHRDSDEHNTHTNTHTDAAPPPADVQQALDRSDSDLADWLMDWGVMDGDDGEVDGVPSSNRQQRPPILLSAVDTTKDQSYFLAACDADSLRNVLFPLGDLYKKQQQAIDADASLQQQHGQVQQQEQQHQQPTVRKLAADMKLPTASKRESMGICFVGKRPGGFRSFVADFLPPATRNIDFVDVDTGAVVATSRQPEHASLYTIGQGAKLGGVSQKYFIVDREPENGNIVRVCAGTHHAALYADSLTVAVHWMARNQAPRPLRMKTKKDGEGEGGGGGEMRAQCRIRHLQPLVDCTIVATATTVVTKDRDSSSGGAGTPAASPPPATTYQVHFDKPVRGITLGQTAVFYVADGLICLGGGPITERGATYFEQGLSLPTDNLHPAGHNDLSVTRYKVK
jgi:tRNA U34 2-thiouridine synthase MnmA/TrmU